MHLPQLNLPDIEARTTTRDSQVYIWDNIRKKEILLTPEEWVRQHFVGLLINHLKYPKSWFRIEAGLSYQKKQMRSDIEVLSPDGSVFLLVECKRADIAINHKTVQQAAQYNKMKQASYLSVTNGIQTFIWKKNPVTDSFESITGFPEYPTLK
ncbi:MAG: hypothetical protein ACI8QD_002317 [Cyclobacteriaceae bacterium]|jgi:hypothetical protein